MDTLLKTYFPIIRTREEVLNLIGEKEKLTNLFESWSEEQQEEFLDFCTGVKGVKNSCMILFLKKFSIRNIMQKDWKSC